jgi:hypothetical protein
MSPVDVPDHAWAAVLSGQREPHFEFLASKVLLTSLRQRLRTNSLTAPDAIKELRAFFQKYANLPSAQKDLAKISAS